MTTKEHKKHTDINRPSYGYYCRNEWAIVGSQCSTIRSLAGEVIKALASEYKCAYADAEHTVENGDAIPCYRENIAATDYTNHHYYHQFNYTGAFNKFRYRQMFNDADLVLVNGNHSEAKSQVVIIDGSKRTSLKKRLSQLTNVELILLAGGETEVFDFIKEAVPSWHKLPVYRLQETSAIIGFFKNKMQQATPVLNGLVLAGGKSVRMGHDKALIDWHGKVQQYYVADLLKNVCDEVYISCRPEQQENINAAYGTIADTFTGLGPYGAILSALREKPDVAWFTVACDLPLLDIDTLQYLKDHRNISSMATAFESPYNHLPEPLVTIWEPKSYPVLLSFLSQGYNCPGKALQNNDISSVKPRDPATLTNVNTREEREKVEELLRKKPAVNDAP